MGQLISQDRGISSLVEGESMHGHYYEFKIMVANCNTLTDLWFQIPGSNGNYLGSSGYKVIFHISKKTMTAKAAAEPILTIPLSCLGLLNII